MYCDDVEISYRFRREGYVLRYCPQSVVHHYSYQSPDELKPLQFTGGLKGTFYIRSIYGTYIDIAVGFLLLLVVSFKSPPLNFSKKDVRLHIKHALRLFPFALKKRKRTRHGFAFRGFDYELRREGAWYDTKGFQLKHLPLVSIVTRTHANRQELLNQAIHSISNQTYARLELVIVEDGSSTTRETVKKWQTKAAELNIKYIEAPKQGRSHTGNVGLSNATGDWVIFLDDDDLLFADHVECLVSAQQQNPQAVAVYGTAIEIHTQINSLVPLNYCEETWRTNPIHDPEFSYEKLEIRNMIPIQAILFKRDLFLQLGGLDVELDALEDWNLWLRYAYGNHFVFIEKQTSLYRVPAATKMTADRQRTLDAAYRDAKLRAIESRSRST
jgi:GT2 family glycosyltransferase